MFLGRKAHSSPRLLAPLLSLFFVLLSLTGRCVLWFTVLQVCCCAILKVPTLPSLPPLQSSSPFQSTLPSSTPFPFTSSPAPSPFPTSFPFSSSPAPSSSPTPFPFPSSPAPSTPISSTPTSSASSTSPALVSNFCQPSTSFSASHTVAAGSIANALQLLCLVIKVARYLVFIICYMSHKLSYSAEDFNLAGGAAMYCGWRRNLCFLFPVLTCTVSVVMFISQHCLHCRSIY